jgi:hypothetical protein
MTRPLAAAFLLLAAHFAAASPFGDQHNTQLPNFAVDISAGDPLGQSFIPRWRPNFAQLMFADTELNDRGATFRVHIREGAGFAGPILGTSRSVYLPDGWGLDEFFGGWIVWLPFNQEVPVVADSPYTFELEQLSGDAFQIFGADPSDYARGDAYQNGAPRSGDYSFVVGSGYDTRPIPDFDNDFDVDGADLLIWQRNAGTVGTAWRRDGDADGDLNVDGADLAAWQANFGDFGHFATTIPEPAALALFALALPAATSASRKCKLPDFPRKRNHPD